MSQVGGSGYKGFRSWAARECPTLKPGETQHLRSMKYHNRTVSSPHPSAKFEIEELGYSTLTEQSYNQVKPTDFKIPDRRGIMSLADQRDSATQSRPFLGKTTYQHHFDLSGSSVERLIQIPHEIFQDAFSKVASKNDGKNICISQIAEVLELVFSAPPEQYELDIFEKAFDGNQSGTFMLDEFVAVVARISGYFDSQAAIDPRQAPSWLKNTTSAEKKILHGHSSQRSHHIDFGSPMKRAYVRKTGMASTTSDLMTGTSRDTNHIPGYVGFIPSAGNNSEAVAHGSGIQSRENRERIYHDSAIPGYTGHKPVSCANYRGETTTGLDKATTNGHFFFK